MQNGHLSFLRACSISRLSEATQGRPREVSDSLLRVAEFSKGCFSETIGETTSLICANHRIAFDTGLFKVGPSTRTLIGCEDSNLTKLGISQTK